MCPEYQGPDGPNILIGGAHSAKMRRREERREPGPPLSQFAHTKMEVEYADLSFGDGYLFATAYTHHAALPIADLELETAENCRTSAEFRFFFVGSSPPLTWKPFEDAEMQLARDLEANEAEAQSNSEKIHAVRNYAGKVERLHAMQASSDQEQHLRGASAESARVREQKDEEAVQAFRARIDDAYKALIDGAQDGPGVLYSPVEDACYLAPSSAVAARQLERAALAALRKEDAELVANHANEEAEPDWAACSELEKLHREYAHQSCADRSIYAKKCEEVSSHDCPRAFTMAKRFMVMKQYRPCFLDDEGLCRSHDSTLCAKEETEKLRTIRKAA
jgi:hypothetical protein